MKKLELFFFGFIAVFVLFACKSSSSENLLSETQANEPKLDSPSIEVKKIEGISSIESHEKMKERLKQAASEWEKMPFYGSLFTDNLRAYLKQAQFPDDLHKFHANMAFSEALRWVGKTEESILVLEQVLKDFERLGKSIIKGEGSHPPADLKYIVYQGDFVGVDEFYLSKPIIYYELAKSYFQMAEEKNCRAIHSEDSCLFPIQGKGIHSDKSGSEKVVFFLEKVLSDSKAEKRYEAKWLYNIAHMTLGNYPKKIPEKFLIDLGKTPEKNFPRFFDISTKIGLNINSTAGGVIVDDFDNDGLFDVIFSDMAPAGQLRFLRNTGKGNFKDVTKETGLIGITGGLNISQTDYNNDGLLDIYVMRGGWMREMGKLPNSLLENTGKKGFVDVSYKVGLAEPAYPNQTSSWGYYDKDGDLDLYVGNEEYPNQLFENRGVEGFIDVAKEKGLNKVGFTKGVTFLDFDQDGKLDLYISNLGPNNLFQNTGSGFVDVTEKFKAEAPFSSFGIWAWDYNNDSRLDLFAPSYVSDLDAISKSFMGVSHDTEPDLLYSGKEDGFNLINLTGENYKVTAPMGLNFGDLNNDGFLDFYLGTGSPSFDSLMPNLMRLNKNGKGFKDVTLEGGFGHLQKGHGIAFADLDNDGDQDIIAQMGGFFVADEFLNAVYENPGFSNNWISIKLVGNHSSRPAIGSKIRVSFKEGNVQRDIYRWVSSGGSFGSNPLEQHIGIGKAEKIDFIEVTWQRSGEKIKFKNIDRNQWLIIEEGKSQFRSIKKKSLKF